MKCVDHAAGTEKEQRLEESVRHQVEDARCECPNTEGKKHIAELADGGVGEHAFDIVLHQSNRGGEKCRDRADNRDDRHRLRRHLINEIASRDHIRTGRDHRRRVDQSANRRRPFHRIGQPGVKRNLCGFSGSSNEQSQRDSNEYRIADMEASCVDPLANRFPNSCELQGAERDEDEHDADGETPVSNPVHHERFLCSVARTFLMEVVPDQQV